MKVINSLQGLQDYGFKPLTGEACNLSMRVLTDMTQEACRIFNECFGLPQDSSFEENWNPGSVASVMLSHDAYKSLGVFALLDDGCHTVMQSTDGVLFGLEAGEEFFRRRRHRRRCRRPPSHDEIYLKCIKYIKYV